MAHLERFGVSMENDLLDKFDLLIQKRGYRSRSEAIRDLARKELVSEEWADPHAEVVGTVTIVYEHHEHELSNILADLQHQYHNCILCTTHIHLDEHNCLEVVIVKGSSEQVKYIANALISIKGVKHGQLSSTSTGELLD